MKPKDLVEQMIGESGITVTAGVPQTLPQWRDKQGNFAYVRATEPRGIQASAMKSLGFKLEKNGTPGVKGYTSNGQRITRGSIDYYRFKPTSLVIEFPEGVDAVAGAQEMVDKFMAQAQGEADKTAKHRAGAPERRREMSKLNAVQYKSDREELYKQYGKQNVQSVTARQIGGDDGYQWNVLINNVPFVNGLMQAQVPYYKKIAYQQLVDKHGVR